MTISSATATVAYTGTGTTGPFAYPFKIFAATDLSVVVTDADTGAETTLAYPADFSVTGVGDDAGGEVTPTSAVATGDTITIRRLRALTQLTSFRNGGAFFPETLEDALDHLVMLCQQQQVDIDRLLAEVFP